MLDYPFSIQTKLKRFGEAIETGKRLIECESDATSRSPEKSGRLLVSRHGVANTMHKAGGSDEAKKINDEFPGIATIPEGCAAIDQQAYLAMLILKAGHSQMLTRIPQGQLSFHIIGRYVPRHLNSSK